MDATRTILIIDDEDSIREALCAMLASHGFAVVEAATGAEALRVAATACPDLIVLDLLLPDMHGNAVCRQLRTWCAAPILVLSARDADREIAELLDLGADDYLTKPFSAVELLARVRALLRRATTNDSRPVITVGALTVDTAAHTATLAGRALDLTPTEHTVLALLAECAGRVVTCRQLAERIWGKGDDFDPQTLRVHVSGLRRKLTPAAPVRIVDAYGIGYRLEGEPGA